MRWASCWPLAFCLSACGSPRTEPADPTLIVYDAEALDEAVNTRLSKFREEIWDRFATFELGSQLSNRLNTLSDAVDLLEHQIDCPVLASPAVRTRVSAEKAAKVCGKPVRRIQYDKWLYRPGLPEQIDILSGHLMRNDLIYFGHAAALQDLLLHLVGAAAASNFGLACLAQLSIELDGHTGRIVAAELERIKSDRALPDGFPFPAPGSAERRPRPAYYYTQSGVVPYQLTEGGARILLISNKSRQRWGVPKGICEPGLSPQVSAAKEALEEAGITGPV